MKFIAILLLFIAAQGTVNKWAVFKVAGTDLVYKVDYAKSGVDDIDTGSIKSVSVEKNDQESFVIVTLYQSSFNSMSEDFKKHFDHEKK